LEVPLFPALELGIVAPSVPGVALPGVGLGAGVAVPGTGVALGLLGVVPGEALGLDGVVVVPLGDVL
jgi:hypothetical protein